MKTLFTKFKSEMNNDSLPFFGEVVLSLTSTDQTGTNCKFNVQGWDYARVIGDGYILDANGQNPVKEKEITQSDYQLYFSSGTYTIGLRNRYNPGPFNLRCGGTTPPTNIIVDLDTIHGMDFENLGSLVTKYESSGSIEGLRVKERIDLETSSASGVSDFEGSIEEITLLSSSSLRSVRLAFPRINGSIEYFSECIKLDYLYLNRTYCTGELNNLVQGMCDNGRSNGTLKYISSHSSTYKGTDIPEFTTVTVSFISSTKYSVIINGVTETWEKSGGTWSIIS